MRPERLQAIVDHIWKKLSEAVLQPDHPWRMMVLATSEPDARMMMLRGAMPEHKRLLLFTDARSRKVARLQADPWAAAVFWSPRVREQVRMSLQVTVHTRDEVAGAHWMIQPANAWLEYAAVAPPRAELAPGHETRPGQLTEALAAKNFAVLSCAVKQMDWMRLGPAAEHIRARFTPSESGWHGVHLS